MNAHNWNSELNVTLNEYISLQNVFLCLQLAKEANAHTEHLQLVGVIYPLPVTYEFI